MNPVEYAYSKLPQSPSYQIFPDKEVNGPELRKDRIAEKYFSVNGFLATGGAHGMTYNGHGSHQDYGYGDQGRQNDRNLQNNYSTNGMSGQHLMR